MAAKNAHACKLLAFELQSSHAIESVFQPHELFIMYMYYDAILIILALFSHFYSLILHIIIFYTCLKKKGSDILKTATAS